MARLLFTEGSHCDGDVDPGNRFRMIESPEPARLGRGLHHAAHPAHSGADHPCAQNFRQLIAQGKAVTDVCRVVEVTQPTCYSWIQQSGGMQAREARRLTRLEKENARLKRLLTEGELEKAMLKDLVAP